MVCRTGVLACAALLTVVGEFAWGLVIPLPQLGARAAANSQHLRSERAGLEAAQLDADVAGTLPNPSLSTQVGTLKSGGSQGVTVESLLSQTMPFPGKLSAQRRVKEFEARLREVSMEKAALLMEHQATLLGFRWAELQEESEHFLERKRRFQVIEEYLSTHPQVSPAQQIESELIHRQIQLIEKEFSELEAEKQSVGLQLQYLVGSTEPVTIEPRWLTPADVPQRTQLPAAKLAQNPDLRLSAVEREQAQGEVSAARKKYYPDLNLGLGYRIEKVEPTNHFYYGALSLSLPLFDHGQDAVPAAQARMTSRTAAAERLQSRLQMESESAWSRVAAAGEVVRSMPLSTADETEAQFQKVEREFKKGRIAISLLLQADAQLHQAVAGAYDAQVRLAQHLSELYLLHGSNFIWK